MHTPEADVLKWTTPSCLVGASYTLPWVHMWVSSSSYGLSFRGGGCAGLVTIPRTPGYCCLRPPPGHSWGAFNQPKRAGWEHASGLAVLCSHRCSVLLPDTESPRSHRLRMAGHLTRHNVAVSASSCFQMQSHLPSLHTPVFINPCVVLPKLHKLSLPVTWFIYQVSLPSTCYWVI